MAVVSFFVQKCHLCCIAVNSNGIRPRTFQLLLALSTVRLLLHAVCQTPPKRQADKETNGQTPDVEFGAF